MPSMPDAIILCGGAGTRLKSITGDAPKSMAAVAGRPFLELLLAQLQRNGFERVILAVGYQKEAIRAHFGGQAYGMNLVYSEEFSPLGTGGAARQAAGLLHSDAAMILNGDSYTDTSLSRFVEDYRESQADASLVVVPADGRTDCGLVAVDEDHRVNGFEEKRAACRMPYVNAGIYLISRSLLCGIPEGLPVSLEREVLPRWVAEGQSIRAFLYNGSCVDIGTPERYQNAQNQLESRYL